MSKNHKIGVFLLIFIIYFFGAFIDVFDVDSGQYASMTREMLESNNWLHFTDRHQPYLDKPPFIFWISGLFYQIFGVSNFSFKLPALLFSLAGVYATFRFAKLYTNQTIAVHAALILASSQAYFHFNTDVRTDVYLTNAVIFSMWQFSAYLHEKRIINFVLAFIGFGIAMLSKGPLGLMMPALGFGTWWIMSKNVNQFFKWKWLLGILISLLVLLPMLWGLYTQFDLQPNQVVNEKTNVSGIRFFFWEQSFGRLTGENVWKNDTGPFFFVHNLLWSFLPWSIILFFALFNQLSTRIKTGFKFDQKDECLSICWSGSLLTFIALSASAYKLPHYIYVIFPLLAIICAIYLQKCLENFESNIKTIHFFKGFSLFFVFIAAILSCMLLFFVFPTFNLIRLIPALLIFASAFYIYFKYKSNVYRILLTSVLAICGFNWVMNVHFYPELLKYQAPGQIARYINANQIDVENVYNYKVGGRSLDFYTQSIVRDISLVSLSNAELPVYLHCDKAELDSLRLAGFEITQLAEFQDMVVTRLNFKFINPKTRADATGKRCLVKVE